MPSRGNTAVSFCRSFFFGARLAFALYYDDAVDCKIPDANDYKLHSLFTDDSSLLKNKSGDSFGECVSIFLQLLYGDLLKTLSPSIILYCYDNGLQ